MRHLFLFVLIITWGFSSVLAQKTEILNESFESASLPSGWTNVIEDGDDNWSYMEGNYPGDGVGTVPSAHSGTYNACFKGTPNPSVTKLVSPAMDLTNGGTLSFWWASHTYFGAGDIDYLRVYYKVGASGDWTLLEEYLDGADTWTEENFNLSVSSDEVYIAFEGSYQGGLGVCVDDVVVFTSDTDLAVSDVYPVLAYGSSINPVVDITNYGIVETSGFDVELTISDGYSETITVNESLQPGATMEVSMPEWTLPADGEYESTASVSLTGDAVSANNSMTISTTVDQTPFGNLLSYFNADFEEVQGYHCAYPETDGEHIYVASWNSDRVARFQMDGTPVGSYFSMNQYSGDDLAFDGEHFYSGDGNENIINKLSFEQGNEQIVSQITTPVQINNLAYLSQTNTFWGNMDNSQIVELTPQGEETGNNISLGGDIYFTSMAIDEFTDPNNPKIWIYKVLAAGVTDKLIEYDLDGNPTGQEIPVNATQFPGVVENDDHGGGLACYVNEDNQVVLLVGVQHLTDPWPGRILSVYIGESVPTYETLITVKDESGNPLENAEVQVNSSKFTALTNASGQVSFSLSDGYYDFVVQKECYQNYIGSFQIEGASPTIEDVILQDIPAPVLSSGEVLEDGQTIELVFDNDMNLNGETAPAGFTLTVNDEVFTINNIELKTGQANTIVLSIADEEIIPINADVEIAYTPGNILSACQIGLAEIPGITITNNSVVSTAKIGKPEIKIYPNPADEALYFSSNENANIRIYDLTGKHLLEAAISAESSSSIDISALSGGIYFVKIQMKSGTFTQKINIK